MSTSQGVIFLKKKNVNRESKWFEDGDEENDGKSIILGSVSYWSCYSCAFCNNGCCCISSGLFLIFTTGDDGETKTGN